MALAAIDDQPRLDDIGTSPPTLDDGACDNRPRLNDIGAPLAPDLARELASWPFGPPMFEPRSRTLDDTTAGCAEDAE